MSAVEKAATAIAATVRKNGWHIDQYGAEIYLRQIPTALAFCTLWCQDASQAKRLAEMMRAPTPLFDAMNLPETPAFPSVSGKA